MWEGNKSQAAALESVLLGGGNRILTVRDLDTLQGRRDKLC